MYKVLLVDDERIIREGIAAIIDWNKNGFSLIDTAANGVEALNIIKQLRPDVVITDVKMPLMDGIELISQVNKFDENIKFIVISGFGEFDLANKAMKYGVKHYLIKPCNENKIIEVLKDVKEDIVKKENKEKKIRNMEISLNKVLPLGKEQFLHDFLMNREFSENEFVYYMKLFNIKNDKLRLAILHIEGDYEFKNMHDLDNIARKKSKEYCIYLKAVVRRHLVLLSNDIEIEKIKKTIDSIKKEFKNKCNMDFQYVYSNVGNFREVPKLYLLTYNKLKYLYKDDSLNNLVIKDDSFNEKVNKKKCSNLVKNIINNIYKNIDNENFSLKWLAREVIFMNEGYLSKVFRRETGEKFSNYLNRVRMEKAISLILDAREDKVYEVADKVGLGLNPQYFSQIFKRYTGFTPTEYKNIKSETCVKKVNSN